MTSTVNFIFLIENISKVIYGGITNISFTFGIMCNIFILSYVGILNNLIIINSMKFTLTFLMSIIQIRLFYKSVADIFLILNYSNFVQFS